jgi:hypothetical protein
VNLQQPRVSSDSAPCSASTSRYEQEVADATSDIFSPFTKTKPLCTRTARRSCRVHARALATSFFVMREHEIDAAA